MRMRYFVRASGLVLALSAAPLAAQTPDLFDGGGYGPTAESAVQAANWDAEVTASTYGLYNCVLVGEPSVFPQPPGSRRAFNAQVTVRCT